MQQEQINKAQEEYDAKFEEIKDVENKVRWKYVKELCELYRKAHPEKKGKEIGSAVKDDCEERLGWNRENVHQALPDFAVGEKASASAKTKWAYKHAADLEKIYMSIEKVSKTQIIEPPIQKEPEEKVSYSGTGQSWEPKQEQRATPEELYTEVVRGCEKVWNALTDTDHLPGVNEDVLLDYIKPSDKHRLRMFKGLGYGEAVNCINILTNVDMVIQRTLRMWRDDISKDLQKKNQIER